MKGAGWQENITGAPVGIWVQSYYIITELHTFKKSNFVYIPSNRLDPRTSFLGII